MTTTEIILKLASELAKYDPDTVVSILTDGIVADEPAKTEPQRIAKNAKAKAPKNEPTTQEWYDNFRSESTEVKVLASTVQVTVKRGHADEWHDKLRATGFSWSRSNRNWWAYLDDEKRAKVATRNAENDAATAGMTAEQKRAYWAARRTARKSA